MELQNTELNGFVNKVLCDSDIHSTEIPDIDLYMDQIITLFEGKLSGNKRRPEDKLLTKTMINNYSKEGLLHQIKGKKYSKEHIIQILLIYNLKQTLSIQDIKSVLNATNGDGEITELYDRFLTTKNSLRKETPVLLQTLLGANEFDGLDETHRKLLLVLAMSSLGNYMKRLCEEIIDNCN
ncbi:uncharacterized protein DUF1836 [Hydrogenoanaerobacterium saccharovorans]|uniref:DUF1836 domain-containing protein n=1 Tax=Hydrogenoanaerobacterium saccharovorans TaxID=474960 RepID=A0A1H7YPU3_9FIRM|nr:DUF1836 domain-containing protein [Hydrogenoanaerobacterium saccharovorans]RPF49095.1 uncharacterized protein DUF1836 [Hydrogenoanaerobacterium saccharovorans]SEM47973.1 protein of unknown function [Hydrogenoanaerobacterium saccharovorans]